MTRRQFIATSGLALTKTSRAQQRAFKAAQIGPHIFRAAHTLAISSRSSLAYISDMLFHRVAVLTPEGRVRGFYGTVGQEAGEFLYPMGLAIDGKEALYVIDSGNRRIQILVDHKVERINPLPLFSPTIAVTSDGDILVNCPWTGTLLSRVNASGRLQPAVGKLVAPSRFWPSKAFDDRMIWRMNRVVAAFAPNDGLYVGFMFLPLVQKYSFQGRLLWEAVLQSPAIDHFYGVCQDITECGHHLAEFGSANLDGIQFPEIVSAITPIGANTIYVALGDGSLQLLHAGACLNRWKREPGGISRVLQSLSFYHGSLFGLDADRGLLRLDTRRLAS